MKKYGGVDSAVALSEIEEATIYTKPPTILNKWQVTKLFATKAAKIVFWEALVIIGVGLVFVIIGSNS